MKDRLLAYLLDDLNPAELTAVEELLASDPSLQQELEKLRECLGCCEAEADPEPPQVPPPQLASRTCHFVEHAIKKSQALCRHSAHVKSLSESHDNLNKRSRLSRADLAVGTCILGALAALVFPGLHRGREDARLAACQQNQHFIVASVMNHSLLHDGQLPALADGDPTGAYLMQLVGDEDDFRRELEQHLVCPSSELAERVSANCIVIRIPRAEQYWSANKAERERLARYMSGSYAYSIGYQDERGELHQVKFDGSREIPMLADAPSPAIAGFQSANHGGCGQNVTFQDLSCQYCKQCKCKAKLDHWFLNDDGKVAPGLHPGDVVLAGSAATPVIKLNAK